MNLSNLKQHPIDYKKTNTGFTLFEMLIVIFIIASIIAIAIPSFLEIVKRWEAKKVRNQIVNIFRLAKTQSYSTHQNIIVCITDDNFKCHKNASSYLLIFDDIDRNNIYDSELNQLFAVEPLDLKYGKIYLRAGNRHHIKFDGNSGLPRGHFGHIKYCPNNFDLSNTYQISLNQQGNHRYKPYSYKKTGCP